MLYKIGLNYANLVLELSAELLIYVRVKDIKLIVHIYIHTLLQNLV